MVTIPSALSPLCPLRTTHMGVHLPLLTSLWSSTRPAFPSGLLHFLPAARQDPGRNPPASPLKTIKAKGSQVHLLTPVKGESEPSNQFLCHQLS